MRSYLVHAFGERARIRHRVFGHADKKKEAIGILKKMEGVVGVKAGENSLLVFLEPDGNLKTVCETLEQAFPELATEESGPSLKADNRKPCASPKAVPPVTRRQLELKALLVSGSATLGLAIFGMHHLHALAGGVFSLFAIQHVWQRKGRL